MDIGWASRQLSHAHSQLELHRINVLWEKNSVLFFYVYVEKPNQKKPRRPNTTAPTPIHLNTWPQKLNQRSKNLTPKPP